MQVIRTRRTIYALSKKAILPDAQVVQLVQQAVREAPSSFNVQSSRVVILFGNQHDHYWGQIVPTALRQAAGEKAVEASKGKLDGFRAGTGTILFFEDSDPRASNNNFLCSRLASQLGRCTLPVWLKSTHGLPSRLRVTVPTFNITAT